ncbi:MAG: type II toxin-antitoxin system PemK/MazF family toxin [bacterium]
MISRAGIYWTELPEQKARPAVIISPGFLNEVRPRLLAAPCTSQRTGEVTHTEVLLASKNLPRPTKVQCQDIASIKKKYFKTHIRNLNAREVNSLNGAIEIATGLW